MKSSIEQGSPSRSLFLSAQREVHCDAFETLPLTFALFENWAILAERARGPKYSSPSPSFTFSIGQCLNDYSNEGHDREALTFVFYSAFIRIWQLRVTQVGLTFTHFFRAVFWGDATREQLGLSRFSPTIVRNVPKSAQSSGQYFKTHCELTQSYALRFLTLRNG